MKEGLITDRDISPTREGGQGLSGRGPSPAVRTGIAAFVLSGLGLFLAGTGWAMVPLAGFVAVCLAAPFFPAAGFFLPVASRGNPEGRRVALTFDDGPDREMTPKVLDILENHAVTATFFVIGQKARQHPDLIRQILEAGHTVGNHTHTHDPLIMLRSSHRLRTEIMTAQETLAAHTVRPLVFRPPAGITNPKLGPILEELKMTAVNFSCRAMDGGNRRTAGLASRILGRVKPGDIVMLHDSCPRNKAELPGLLAEIETLIHGLRAGNLTLAPLADLLEKPVMAEINTSNQQRTDNENTSDKR
ncbi:MAG: polysaccharide deacetylase family protein [Pseudomonadota bacterium]